MHYQSIAIKLKNKKLTEENVVLEGMVTRQNDLLQEKDRRLQAMQLAQDEMQAKIKALEDENRELSKRSIDWDKIFVIKIGHELKPFLKEEIRAFIIRHVGEGEPKQSITDMYLQSGQSHMLADGSLAQLEKQFPEFRQLSRGTLISPKSVVGFEENNRKEVEIQLDFRADPFILTHYKWHKQKKWVEEVVADNRNKK